MSVIPAQRTGILCPSAVPVRSQKGKQIVDLKPKMVLWLPNSEDIKEFRGRIFGGLTTKFEYASQYKSPEEELAAVFGGRPEDYRAEASAQSATSKASGEGASEPRVDTEQKVADVPAAQVSGGEPDVLSGKETAASSIDGAAAAAAVAEAKHANIESMLGPTSKKKDDSGRIKYTVRLGDTLKSVAMKHPALRDVTLWKLIAEINELSTSTDSKGAPTAALKRGTVVEIPTPGEVAEFLQREDKDESGAKSVRRPRKGTSKGEKSEVVKPDQNMSSPVFDASPGGSVTEVPSPVVQAEVPSSGQEHRVASFYDAEDAASVVLAAAGLVPVQSAKEKLPPKEISIEQTVAMPADDDDSFTRHILAAFGQTPSVAEPSLPTASVPVPQVDAAPAMSDSKPDLEQRAVNNLIEELSEACRLVKSTGQGALDAGLKSRLEVQHLNAWMPVVMYEIYDDVSLRHEFSLNGKQKTVRIDLPPSSVQELADNDLTSNWQDYCQKFLAGRKLSD
ncbi:MAG: hypothetical protein HY711_08680 [Candidatus Melainabacteria bacterium]|nr:hypothetical protein [Candidatus Melainabacteria bacterium]